MACSMVASAATGAGLELLFGNFLKVVLEVQKNHTQFKSSLKRIEKMLLEMDPYIKKIESFNLDFDRPKEIQGLKDLITKGQNLVLECSTIHKYNCVKRPLFNKKLLKFEKSLRDYVTTFLPIQQSADIKETLFTGKEALVVMKGVSTKFDQLADQMGKQLSMSVSNGSSNGFLSSKSNIGLVGVCSPPKLKVDPVGLEIPLREVKIKLLKDESSKLIVLSAPGGCGKTTLATAICQDEDVEEKFKGNIFFVTLSKQPTLLLIVERLFLHNNCKLPEIRSEEDAVNHLERLFKQIGSNPILLVLDDVWDGSEHLLEKLKFRMENYKILVTSRYEFPRFGASCKLHTLNFVDAMTLFRQLALLPVENSYTPDNYIVEEIVKCCKGFPLAISVVGKSLRRRSAAEWRKRLKECSKTASILSDSELLNCLQSSVDALNDLVEVKECYMDLGSFPEDQKIPAAALIDMWAELYNLGEDDAIANLHELSERSLVELLVIRKDANEDDGSYNEHFVTQHDLLRELAIRQSTTESIENRKRLFVDIIENKIPGWLMEQMQPLIRAKLLSISTDETFSASWCNMQAPEVEVLVLNSQTKNYSFPKFMERMDNLKVLILNNHGFFPAELNNFPVLGALSNLKRIRLEKVSIPSFFLTSVQLSKLEKISLVMCNVGQAFNNPAIKISDAFPNLVEINIDYSNDLLELPAGFSDLALLKKLSITNCHKLSALPEEIGKLQNLEGLRLNSCIELSELPGTTGRLHKLQILDLSDCLSITELPEEIGQLHNLRKLYMIECSSCELPTSVMNLANLKEVIVDEGTAISWERFEPVLPSLKIKVHKEINLNWLGNHRFK